MHYSHLRNLLVWLAAMPWLAGAQAPSTAERPEPPELVYSGEPGEQPLVLHGVPDMPMVIMLDTAVKLEGVRSPPGVDIRPYPARQDRVLVTPAATGVAPTAIPFAVPLADGTILNFTLVPAQGAGDVLVRVRRVPRLPEREALARCEGERGAALAPAVDAATGRGARCTLVALDEEKTRDAYGEDCRSVGKHAYVRIKSLCTDATVGIAGSPQAGASIVFGETECTQEGLVCTTRLVLRKHAEGTGAATVELRGRDGALCQSFSLQAW